MLATVSPHDLALEATIHPERALKASSARWVVSDHSARYLAGAGEGLEPSYQVLRLPEPEGLPWERP